MGCYRKYTIIIFVVILATLGACDNSPSWEDEINKGVIEKIIIIEMKDGMKIAIEVDSPTSIEALKKWLLESTLPKYGLATQVNTSGQMELHYKNTIKVLKVGGLEEYPVPIIYKKHYRFAARYPDIPELSFQQKSG